MTRFSTDPDGLPPSGMLRRVNLIDGLRGGQWLHPARASAYGRMVAVLVLIQAVNLTVRIIRSAIADPHFRPEPTDFDTFWAASHLTLQGHAALAYNPIAMQAAEAIGAQARPGMFFPYLNPPSFLLLCAPLALLPYLPAMAAFVLASYAGIVLSLRRILPATWPTLPILALPVAMLNGTEGQNGSISALCFAGGLLLLERRPIAAGLCLGVLSYKPHLAVCVPLALLVARRWSALLACGTTALALALVSWAVLGSQPWTEFVQSMPMMRSLLDDEGTWSRVLSFYAAARLLHGGPALASAVQAAVGASAILLLARVAWRRPGAGAEVSALAAAAMLVTPYVQDYDLVCIAVPMAWLAACGGEGGWLTWEKLLLASLYLVPLLARQGQVQLGLPLAQPLLLLLLLAITRRAPGRTALPAPHAALAACA